MKNIKEVIFEMLTENTGSSILDSGGAYGRNWQRNQKLTIEDFEKRPAATLEISIWKNRDGEKSIEAFPTVDLFHKLTSVLEIDEKCQQFNDMPVEDWDSDLYGVSQDGKNWLIEHFEIKGDAWNTYNWDNNFSQIIQGQDLECIETGDAYVLVQIHGGCDARGGYTNAKLFKVSCNEHHAVVRDDCTFGFEDPDDPEKYRALDWLGEFINYEGTCADDSDFEAAVKSLGVTEDESKTIEGDICECN